MEKKLIFLGPPGSGKGTQAKEIACELGLAHISMGDILRQAIKDRTPSGIKAEEHLKAGTLVPDDLVNEIARDVLRKASGGFILDGYPRTVYQAKFLAGITDITKAVYIDVPKDEIVKRLSGRLSCKDCGRVYHICASPPKEEGKCDFCSSPLYIRNDDKEETILKRLEVFEKETSPLKSHYEEKGLLSKVNGSGTTLEVKTRVLSAV